jgi:hypothetical protein
MKTHCKLKFFHACVACGRPAVGLKTALRTSKRVDCAQCLKACRRDEAAFAAFRASLRGRR